MMVLANLLIQCLVTRYLVYLMPQIGTVVTGDLRYGLTQVVGKNVKSALMEYLVSTMVGTDGSTNFNQINVTLSFENNEPILSTW